MAKGNLKVTLTGSMAGQLKNIQASGQDFRNSVSARGMIRTAQHLLRVEQA